MALWWMAWATMASPIQLFLPALEISSIYNSFSPRFPFPVVIHRHNVCRVKVCIIYHPFNHLVTMHVCKRVGIY